MMFGVSFLSSVSIAILITVSSTLSASADYIVRVGDVLEIDVAGVSSLHQRMPVGVDGNVSVPIVGPVAADGKTITEITETIQVRLSSKPLRQTSPTGEEFQLFFEPEQIQVFVSEYRPVYVSGDVAHPGQQTFRPGMTVRQSIALAGGYDILRSRLFDPVIQIADLSAELNALRLELARDQIQVQRIKSELAGDTEPPVFSTSDIGLVPDVRADLVRLEKERFKINVAEHANEIEFIKSAIQSTEAQEVILNDQLQREKEALAAELQESERLTELAKKGMVTSAREFEARRAMLFASAQYLQTVAQVAQLKKDRVELSRQLEKLAGNRRAALLKDLQDAMIRIEVTAEKIKSVMEKLAYAAGAQSSFQHRETQVPKIFIVRETDGRLQKTPADEDARLMPGDVVEAKLMPLEHQTQPVLTE